LQPPILPILGIRMTLIQRMLLGLQHLRRNQNMQPEIVSSLSAARCKSGWDGQLTRMPEWAMYCEEFVGLPADQKLAVYKGCLKSFFRLERFHITAKIFGKKILEKSFDKSLVFVLTDEVAVDFVTTVFDFSLLTDYDQGDIKKMHLPFYYRFMQTIARPMIELKVTDTELVFTLAQLVWHLEG
ncbi:hypothetical protein PMAYCL1PPCAC_21254, partial [Pristionchus mayeri]